MSLRIGSSHIKEDSYLNSEEMDLTAFKDKMKSLNNKLSSSGHSLDYKTILESLVGEFCLPSGHNKSISIDLSSPHLQKRVYSTESTNEI